ncbi:hypothetical protein BG003_004003 [Podila horticola]|nr:hypothetical protein BG003_004003 [Podila horticola]
MKFSTLVAAAAAVTLQVQVALAGPTFTDCAPPGIADFTVTNFTISSPFCPGKNYTLTATGTLAAPIIAPSKLSISAKYLGRVAYTDNLELCQLLADAGSPCPVPITASSLSLNILLKPSFPPNVPMQFTFQVNNGNNHILFCRAATLKGDGTWLEKC